MSDNIFIKSDINEFISSVESENINLPQWLNIVDKNTEATSQNGLSEINNMKVNSETSVEKNLIESETSVFDNKFIENLSATSDNDIFIGQAGGSLDKNISSPDDINNLINMLTSENANDNFDTVTTVTNTEVLEDQLRDLLNQAGGAKKSSKKASKKSSKKASKKSSKKASKKSSKKASKKSSKKASKKSSKKASKGGKKSKKTSKKAPKKASKKASKKTSKKASKKTSKKASKKSKAGKKAVKKTSKKASKKTSKKASKKTSKKASKKTSKKASKKSKKMKGEHEEEPKETKEKPKRAANPGFTAFLNLKKHVAEKLGIPNGIPAGKIAGMAKKEYTEMNEGISAVEASEGAMKYFDENIEKFKKELEKL